MTIYSRMGVFTLQGLRRERRQLISGISKVRAGEPFRVGSQVARLPVNVFFAKYHADENNIGFSNTALTWDEEEKVVQKLQEEQHTNGYIPHESIMDATQEFVRSLPFSRRRMIRFKNGRPSKTFCKLFQKRHCYGIYCTKPEEKNGIEAPLVSAKDVVTYFHDIRDMITKDKVDANRIWCLTAHTVPVNIGEEDSFIEYFTMFAVTNAAGLLLSYTHLVHNNEIEDAVIEQSDDFEAWITFVADKMEELNSGAQDLNSDSYHLMLCDESYLFVNNALRDWLFKRQVIVFSIPGLCDGFVANHDVGCSSVWAQKFQEYAVMDIKMRSPPKRTWTEGTLLMFAHMARYASLTPRQISDSFADAGIFPLDEVRFFKHPRPMSFSNTGKICDIGTMCKMLDQKSDDKGSGGSFLHSA